MAAVKPNKVKKHKKEKISKHPRKNGSTRNICAKTKTLKLTQPGKINGVIKGRSVAKKHSDFVVSNVDIFPKKDRYTHLKRKIRVKNKPKMKNNFPNAEDESSFTSFLKAIAERNIILENTEGLIKCVADAIKFLSVKDISYDALKQSNPGKVWLVNFFIKRPQLLKLVEEYAIEETDHSKSIENSFCYNIYDDYIKKYDLSDVVREPTRIFYLSDIRFDIENDSKDNFETQLNSENCVNMLTMISVVKKLPSMIAFSFNDREKILTSSIECSDLKVGRSQNGNVIIESLYDYLINTFCEWLDTENISRPVIVWGDFHKIQLDSYLFCSLEERGVILMGIPKNCTHFFQPFKVGMEDIFIEVWRSTSFNWCISNPKKRLSTQDFLPQFSDKIKAIHDSINVRELFKSCGLYPWSVQIAVSFL